jgi:hypothetical protein
MIRNCTINGYGLEEDYSFVGDVYYNDEHEVIETSQGVVEYEMKIITTEKWSYAIGDTMEIETFDGELLGRKKMIAVDWVGDEAIIYLK